MNTNNKWILVSLVLATSGLGCTAEMDVEPEGTEATSEALATAHGFAVTSYTYNLGYHGGTGGTASRLACNAGDVAVGLYGSYGNYVNELGLICAHLYSNGTLGVPYTTAPRGTPGPTPFTFQCPMKVLGFSHDEFLTGFRGRSGTYLDANIGGLCQTLPSFDLATRYVFGTSGGGTRYEDECPAYYGVTSIYIRAASWVDGFRGTCSYIEH
jgi:hypothetical protein